MADRFSPDRIYGGATRIIVMNEKYSIHYGRFETHWHAFCEENHFDLDDENVREIWEKAFVDGAISALEGLDVVKRKKQSSDVYTRGKADV